MFTVYPIPGRVDKAMRTLGMAQLLFPDRDIAKLAIEPWLVQAAFVRLGDRQLTVAEQEVIVAATRKPHKVRWPEWWLVNAA